MEHTAEWGKDTITTLNSHHFPTKKINQLACMLSQILLSDTLNDKEHKYRMQLKNNVLFILWKIKKLNILGYLYLDQFTDATESKMILNYKTAVTLSWTMAFIILACSAKSVSLHGLHFGGNRTEFYTAVHQKWETFKYQCRREKGKNESSREEIIFFNLFLASYWNLSLIVL